MEIASDRDSEINQVDETIRVEMAIDGDGEYGFTMRVSSMTDVARSGLQVWPCSQLVVDWIVARIGLADLRRRTILEIGSGPGLVAVAIGPFTRRFIASDHDDAVRRLCTDNIRQNAVASDQISVVDLDVFEPDLALLQGEIDYVIACDMIFDCALTSALVSLVKLVLETSPTTRVIMANESRLNFLISTMSVGDCAMDWFDECLSRSGLKLVMFDPDRIPTCLSIPRSSSSIVFELIPSHPD